jgi:hypothetical protein
MSRPLLSSRLNPAAPAARGASPAPTLAAIPTQAPAAPNVPDCPQATSELAKEIKALRTAIVSTAAGNVMTGRSRSPFISATPGSRAASSSTPQAGPTAVEEIEALKRELRHTSEAYAALSKQSRAQKLASEQKEREMGIEIHRLKSQVSIAARLC